MNFLKGSHLLGLLKPLAREGSEETNKNESEHVTLSPIRNVVCGEL